MNIRHISADELPPFVQLSANPDRLQKVLNRFWLDGESRPEFCFVAESEGRFIAGAIYISFASNPESIGLWDLFLPNSDDGIEIGRNLISSSASQFRETGASDILAQVSSLDADESQRCQVIQSAGFQQQQTKSRYEFFSNIKLGAVESRLTFVNLESYGEEAFINLVESVTRATLDREDQRKIVRFGSHTAAKNYFNLLKDIDFQPDIWQIGLDSKGKAVGLVVPQIFSSELGAINYIGVIPEYRGAGYGLDLLQRGTTILLDRRIARIIGDIDDGNYPIVRSLKTLGYQLKSTLSCFALEFDGI